MPDGCETVHCIRTCDAGLVEKIVHRILDDYRYDPNREWFQGDAELFARVVNAAARFVEGLIVIDSLGPRSRSKPRLTT